MRRDWRESALGLLFPERPRCALCQSELPGWLRVFGDAQLCRRCQAGVHPLAEPECRVCGKARQGEVCQDCLRGPHVFFTARAYGHFDGVAEQAIKALKYQGNRELVPILGEWLVQAYVRYFGDDRHMLVTPVPMHPVKQRRRGFNQAEEIARVLCRRMRLKTVQPLRRVRLDQSQTTTATRAARLAAMESAFALAGGESARMVRGNEFLLVDDVLTTGGTADACARVLFEQGAVSVHVLTVAR